MLNAVVSGPSSFGGSQNRFGPWTLPRQSRRLETDTRGLIASIRVQSAVSLSAFRISYDRLETSESPPTPTSSSPSVSNRIANRSSLCQSESGLEKLCISLERFVEYSLFIIFCCCCHYPDIFHRSLHPANEESSQTVAQVEFISRVRFLSLRRFVSRGLFGRLQLDHRARTVIVHVAGSARMELPLESRMSAGNGGNAIKAVSSPPPAPRRGGNRQELNHVSLRCSGRR